jgi:hypothetical protein
MKHHLYPPNWRTIAFIVKNLSKWNCQHCGRPCRRLPPKPLEQESWNDFTIRIFESEWYEEAVEEIVDEETGEFGYRDVKGRFVLTTAHLDHDPENPEPRLKALCPKCHNCHDAPTRAKNAKKTRFDKAHRGQLNLFKD